MPKPKYQTFAALLQAVEDGKITDEQIFFDEIDSLGRYLNKTPYTTWLKTQHTFPNQDDLALYLAEIKQTGGTVADVQSIHARKNWVDVVSAYDHENEQFKMGNQTPREYLIKALVDLKYQHPETVYEKCMEYLKNCPVVMSFDADLLRHGLIKYKTLNVFETGSRGGPPSSGYLKLREQVEKDLFSPLRDKYSELYATLIASPQIRPRYASLALTDGVVLPEANEGYGKSFIVFKPQAKLNCLYVPDDSLGYSYKNYQAASYSHLENMLAQCAEAKLAYIAEKVMAGRLGSDYSKHQYIEVLMPQFNVLDPNLIEHIHISPEEYTLSDEEKKQLSQLGLAVSTEDSTPYRTLTQQFFAFIQKGSSALPELAQQLTQHPSLLYSNNPNNHYPLRAAQEYGDYAVVKYLLGKIPLLPVRMGSARGDFLEDFVNVEPLLEQAIAENHQALIKLIRDRILYVVALGAPSFQLELCNQAHALLKKLPADLLKGTDYEKIQELRSAYPDPFLNDKHYSAYIELEYAYQKGQPWFARTTEKFLELQRFAQGIEKIDATGLPREIGILVEQLKQKASGAFERRERDAGESVATKDPHEIHANTLVHLQEVQKLFWHIAGEYAAKLIQDNWDDNVLAEQAKTCFGLYAQRHVPLGDFEALNRALAGFLQLRDAVRMMMQKAGAENLKPSDQAAIKKALSTLLNQYASGEQTLSQLESELVDLHKKVLQTTAAPSKTSFVHALSAFFQRPSKRESGLLPSAEKKGNDPTGPEFK